MILDTTLRSVVGVAVREGRGNAPWCLFTSRPDVAAGRRVLVLWPAGALQETGRVGSRNPKCAPTYPIGDVYAFELDIPAMAERTAFRDAALVVEQAMPGGARWNAGFFIAHMDADADSELIQQCYGVRAKYFFVTSSPLTSPARWYWMVPEEDHRTPTCGGRFGEPLTDTTTIEVEYVEPVPPGVMNVTWSRQADSLDPSTNWLALRQRESKWELVETRVSYKSAEGVCGEETGGRAASPAIEGEWLAVFAGIPGLRAGQVTAAAVADTSGHYFINASGKTDFADSVVVDFAGRHYKVRQEPSAEFSVRLFIAPGGKPLILYSSNVQDEGGWAVIWAGDIDRDGELDILLSATRKYSVDSWQLHLSTFGKGNGRWLPVARAFEVGC